MVSRAILVELFALEKTQNKTNDNLSDIFEKYGKYQWRVDTETMTETEGLQVADKRRKIDIRIRQDWIVSSYWRWSKDLTDDMTVN